jgi:hypothetical protein
MVAVNVGDEHDIARLGFRQIALRRIDLNDFAGVLDLQARVLKWGDGDIAAGSRHGILCGGHGWKQTNR